MIKYLSIIFISFLFISCGGGGGSTTPTITESQFDLNVSSELAPSSSKIPAQASTWNIQLNGTVDESLVNIDVYEVDLFDSSAELIERLKNDGNTIVNCYINSGAYEEWRDDASDFPSEVLGNSMENWEGEKWLDIRNAKLAPIMEARLELALTKGCDGVVPDNMNGYINSTGFNLTANDQLAYNRYIANTARSKGLSIALKNDWEQVDDLLEYFDFAVSEECFEQSECDKLQPFIDAGKAVLNIEYASEYVDDLDARTSMCTDSNNKKFSTLVMKVDLDEGSRLYSCN